MVSDFAAEDLQGARVVYSARAHKITVVIFISARCPMSNGFNSRINALVDEFSGRVRFLVLNSNADESLEEVRHHSERTGYDFPVYKDVNNLVADLFGAIAIPDAFVMD